MPTRSDDEPRRSPSFLSQFPVAGCLIAIAFATGITLVLTQFPGKKAKEAPPAEEEEEVAKVEKLERKIEPGPRKIDKKKDNTRIDPEQPPIVKKKEAGKTIEQPKTIIDPAEEARRKEADARNRLAGVRALAKGANPGFALQHARDLIKLYPNSPEAREAQEIIRAIEAKVGP